MTGKNKSWQIPLTITLVLLGFLLSVQFKVQQDLLNTLNMQKTEDLVAMLRNIHYKKASLETEVDELQFQLSEYKNSLSVEQTLYANMTLEINRLQVAYGTLDVHGPGISVILYGDSLLIFYDIIDIINELWASGAEVISINDHRIYFNTRFTDATINGSLEIMVNDEMLLYPIIIQAIGDPHALETGLTFPGGIVDNLTTLYNIHPEIKRETEILIPATVSPRRGR
ncbi:MAG: DUF881 domain-containing protein [Clostridia bacterium]|nr:DUF881 domain-containing protein [Clostridia bacterium]